MNRDDADKRRRIELRRLLMSVPPALPGTAMRHARGTSSVGLGDIAPVVKGAVSIKLRDVATGREIVVLEEDANLVVTQAGALMALMSAGAVNSEIGYIELGDPAPATPPSLADTGLEQTTGQRKAVTYFTSGNVVTFQATWAAGEGNGNVYTEAGLFTNPLGSGSMFARKTGFSIAKTVAFSMTFTWSLTFSVVDACQEACNGVSLMGSSYVVEDFIYDAAGGETSVVVPIDFVVGAKRLHVFLNGQRLYYQRHYIESTLGPNKGITLQGFSLSAGPPPDDMYFWHQRW